MTSGGDASSAARANAANARPRPIIFSDLDGTLLDHTTYAFDAAQPALDRLKLAAVPLVLCSSKTRAEIESVRAGMHNDHPFVSENGGAVFIPAGYFPFEIDGAERRDDYLVVEIGDPYVELVAALARASRSSGVPVRGFAEMTDGEVAAVTGLPPDQARLARRREYDEAFQVIDSDRARPLLEAIEREGKRWTSGGRFFHIMGESDKAVAVRLLAVLYRRSSGAVITVGLGDAPNDAGFLAEVDVPIVLASAHAAELRALVPHSRLADRPGPVGWNHEVLALLDELR
jgi:mannosyl-3-phosphoglycerate phosphatase